MKRALETFMYGLCWRGDWITRLVGPVWYRWYCPHPLRSDWTARACIAAGDCGCDNGLRIIIDLHNRVTQLEEQFRDQRCPVDVRGTIRECIASGQCGCTNGLIVPATTVRPT